MVCVHLANLPNPLRARLVSDRAQGAKGSDPSVYVFTVYDASTLMSCPASAGAAETANGAVERMVLPGLTSRIISNFVVRFLLAAKDTKGAILNR